MVPRLHAVAPLVAASPSLRVLVKSVLATKPYFAEAACLLGLAPSVFIPCEDTDVVEARVAFVPRSNECGDYETPALIRSALLVPPCACVYLCVCLHVPVCTLLVCPDLIVRV